MRLRHIEVFHAIYVTGSITNAANFLHVSQPSVSKVLAHAEMQLGFALFQRIKGRLVPTAEAQMLFSEIDKVYKQIRSVRNSAINLKKVKTGNINIGLTPALGFDLIPNAVAQYKAANPQVNINLQTMHNDEVHQALLEHKIDFALMFSPPPLSGVTAQSICQSELVMMYPQSFYPHQPASINLSEIAGYQVIGIWDSGPLGDLLWNRLSEDDIEVNADIKVQTYFIAARLAAQGMGVCIIDEFTAQGNLCHDVAIAKIEPALKFNLKALHLENKTLSHVANDFLNLINELANAPKSI
ncbi:MAG: LysR family transcriptional regulator [Psychrobium sp.]